MPVENFRGQPVGLFLILIICIEVTFRYLFVVEVNEIIIVQPLYLKSNNFSTKADLLKIYCFLIYNVRPRLKCSFLAYS